MSQALKCCPTYSIKRMGWIEAQGIFVLPNEILVVGARSTVMIQKASMMIQKEVTKPG